MAINRVWAMPNSDTFDIEPIGAFVRKYLADSKVSVDPFARNRRWATHTNDLNPKMAAEHHLEALDFIEMLDALNIKADLALFDPPYSHRQVLECYESIGREFTSEDQQQIQRWTSRKNALMNILTDDGIVLSFGWNSTGMGKTRGFEPIELLLVNHGSAHNDTICLAERRIQGRLFSSAGAYALESGHADFGEGTLVADGRARGSVETALTDGQEKV